MEIPMGMFLGIVGALMVAVFLTELGGGFSEDNQRRVGMVLSGAGAAVLAATVGFMGFLALQGSAA